jgi:hypothetical protein
LELRDVQQEIFAAGLVDSSDYAPFDNRPEAFDGVGVDRADNVLAGRVVDDAVFVPEMPSPG